MTDTIHKLTPPLGDSDVRVLKAGDHVLISGTIYTARDAAHRRLAELIAKEQRLPVDLAGQVIYYTGPAPASPGRATGSAGPTTSSRMDRFTPTLLRCGPRALIGKGDRSDEVVAALQKHGAIYLAAVGGAGALLAQSITAAEAVAYTELGAEAIYRMEVKEFPAIVVIDTHGGNLYREGRNHYMEKE